MSEPAPKDQSPSLSFHHVQATTAVFIGVTQVAYRSRFDLITGERSDLESAVNQPIHIKNFPHFQQIFGPFLEHYYLPDAVYGYFANGGAPCYVMSIRALSNGSDDPLTAATYTQAFQSLATLAETYLLICPDLALSGADGTIDIEPVQNVHTAMTTHCEQHSGCFAILDMPPGFNALQASNYRQSLYIDSASAALYHPWLQIPDLSDSPSTMKYAPPSGHIAGIFFRVQQEYGRVLAPANEMVKGALDLMTATTQGEEDVLLTNQVNCIRIFSGRGIYLWGARTLDNALILVGNNTGTTRNFGKEGPRIPKIVSEGIKMPAFIGITQEASIKAFDYESGNMVPVQSCLNNPVLVTSWQAYTAVFGGFLDNAYLPDAVYGFFANGGALCYVVSVQSVTDHETFSSPPLTINDIIGDTVERTGLASLEALDNIDLIACPDLMYLDGDQLSKDELPSKIKAVQTAMLAHCERMGNRMALLDIPSGLNPQQAKEWRYFSNYDTTYAAMYYPWVDILDHAGRKKRVPSSGHMAGIYQRESQQYGLHKPPANTEIYGAVNLEINVTNGEQAVLTPIGVNCLRAFPSRGIRPWSARTLSSDGSYRYIHTRRLLIMIKSAIYQGTSWVQFELHDPTLLARVHQQIADFLERLRVEGMLIGDSPEEAYYIQCDEELNPPEKQQQGELTAKIGVALMPNYMFQLYIRQTNSRRRTVAEGYF
jgi:phage tail sheath protein FI